MARPVSEETFSFRPSALLLPIAISAFLVYIGACVYLFSLQNSITYPREATGAVFPTETAARIALGTGLVPWDHTTPGAVAPQGYVRPDFAAPTRRGTIVLFHGNGGCAWDRNWYVEAFAQRGFRTFLYEYPGYGGRPGTPGEAAIVPDGQALVRSLDQAGYGPIYVWGESLGTGVAAAVCHDSTLPVHGLVLLAPWDNIANVGLHFYPYIPVRWLLIDKYDSIANLQHFGHPICIVCGTIDPVIPPALTQNLYDHLSEPRKMIVQHGFGHIDWPHDSGQAWWDEALDFMAPTAPVR
jgi:pimeloyl-ACP methyl ester carboxylesterase